MEMRQLAVSKGWPVNYPTANGLVQIGTAGVPNNLEGKSLNNVNCDVLPLNGTTPSAIGADLYEENMYRDFACNSL